MRVDSVQPKQAAAIRLMHSCGILRAELQWSFLLQLSLSTERKAERGENEMSSVGDIGRPMDLSLQAPLSHGILRLNYWSGLPYHWPSN